MTKVLLNTINLQAPTQLREAKESQIHIEDLAHSYAEKGKFSELPLVARIDGGDVLVPIDGFHRLHAIEWLASEEYQALNDAPSVAHLDLTKVEVRITTFATMSEAIIAAAGVNSNHGLKRKNGDIRSAIEAILEVEPMLFMDGKYKLNKKAIMDAVKCSTRSFNRETKSLRNNLESMRDDVIMEMNAVGKSQRDIAGAVGVSPMTVNTILKTVQNEPVAETVQPGELSVQNGYDSETVQSEESPTVFTHATSVTPIANPWETTEEESTNTVEPVEQEEVVEVPQAQPDVSVSSIVAMFNRLDEAQKDEALLIFNDLVA